LVFTTRSAKKGLDTLKTLQKQLSQHTPSSLSVHFLPEIVDLTNLLSVRALAQRLLKSDIPKLDAVILNAGIIGLTGLDWPLAIWTVATDPVHTLCWPQFKVPAIGLATEPQFPPTAEVAEPPLGEVFCANVFGHYLLSHWLMPLLQACSPNSPGKVIWIGSIEATARHFNRDDIQGLRSPTAYEHSKRLTELMALTARDQPSTSRDVQNFLTPTLHVPGAPKRLNGAPPGIHIVHPGTCATAIVPLPWLLLQLFILAAYFARFLGSPWCTVTPYAGSHSATWLTLASVDEIDAKEADGGRGAAKWGSGVSRSGRTRVEKTDVEGWGLCGSGIAFADSWWAQDMFGSWGRIRGSTDATSEDIERFVEDGAWVWREMERLRVEWEARIEEYEHLLANSGVKQKS
jgi:3-keto steroid reductase